ncbi:MAG: Gfo/Idh/MocA family oxidoreductase [Bryobacterales bacterium]|nr:Gfo/Idh/MocA family oxidoreductase [Bryobacterales bacterium]
MSPASLLSRRDLLAAAAALKLPQKIKVAMIGLDGHPTEVTRPLPQLPDVDMVGVWDPNPKSVERFLKAPRHAAAKPFTEWRKMLDEVKPDVVGVCHANSHHAEAIIECLGRGIHVIGEKPIATDLASLKQVQRAVESSRAKFTSMLPMRFSPAYQALRDVVRSGEIGEVIQMDAQKSYQVSANRPAWFYQRSTYGGTMAWIGIHMIDLMIYTTGRDFTEAFGFQNHLFADGTGDTENVTATAFKLDNGGVALLRMDYLRPNTAGSHGDDRLRLAGSKGIAEYMEATGVTVMSGARKGREKIEALPAERSLFTEFLDHVYNAKPAPIPWKEILRGHQVALAARDAMEAGKPVKV